VPTLNLNTGIAEARFRCQASYARFKNISELSEEQLDALEDEKAQILAEYEKIVSPKSLVYKEGSTQRLMNAACREFTARVSLLICCRHLSDAYLGIFAYRLFITRWVM
jgi:hypothetical protein